MNNHHSWSPGRIALAFIFIILISTFLFGALGLLLATQVFQATTSPEAIRMLQALNSLGLFLVPPLVLAYWTQSDPKSFLGLNFPSSIPTLQVLGLICLCIGAFFVIDALSFVNTAILPETAWVANLKAQENLVQNTIGQLLANMTPWTLVLNTLIMVLIPALGEELFFRGSVQSLLSSRFTSHTAILIAALFFGAGHIQPLSFLPIFFMGIIFGYARLWTGTLWVPIALHFINNGYALASAYLNEGVLNTENTMVGSPISFLGIGVFIIGLWLTRKHQA